MEKIIKRHTISFKNAFAGLAWAYKTQPNYVIHLLLSGVALFAGYFFSIRYEEWLVIILTITIGLVVETLNTAIEVTTDAIDTSIRNDIKIAKDTAAAAMLTYAVGAFIIAFLIFYPRITHLLQ